MSDMLGTRRRPQRLSKDYLINPKPELPGVSEKNSQWAIYVPEAKLRPEDIRFAGGRVV